VDVFLAAFVGALAANLVVLAVQWWMNHDD
jgi:hypothetical protein